MLILFCDDLRIGASDSVLEKLHLSFFNKFGVTTAPGNRFLGMDTCYQRERGVLKLSMENYIDTTVERFKTFDTSRGYPYRELVGCLLWMTIDHLNLGRPPQPGRPLGSGLIRWERRVPTAHPRPRPG